MYALLVVVHGFVEMVNVVRCVLKAAAARPEVSSRFLVGALSAFSLVLTTPRRK
jgi:hypothetical protein